MDDDFQPLTKTGKKIIQQPVESTINQRPRRSIKHKFIKCNRDSPEKSFGFENPTEFETTVEDVYATTCQESTSKPKNRLKTYSKKNARSSGRQNRSKNTVPDADDSNLQMVEIIDDPSDDPNVSIAEIIETCVLDTEEYMRTCSRDVSNDSSSNTTIDYSEESSLSSSKNKINSNALRLSVGLVDCMKNKSILKHLNLDEHKVSDSCSNSSNSSSTFEGVLTKSQDEVKVDAKPIPEFCTPIRTRRVTRLSTISARRSIDVKVPKTAAAEDSASIIPNPKVIIHPIQQIETTPSIEPQRHISVEISENSATLPTESSSDHKMEPDTAILATPADPVVSSIETIETETIVTNQLLENTEENQLSTSVVPIDSIEISGEIKTDSIECNYSVAETTLEPLKIEMETESEPIPKEKCEIPSVTEEMKILEDVQCTEGSSIDNNPKEKTKSKKERKRAPDVHIVQPDDEVKSQLTSVVDLTEQDEVGSAHHIEKKSPDSEPSKQMDCVIEIEDSPRKQSSPSEHTKTEKLKKKKDSHSDKEKKAKRISDSSKKSDSSSTHKSTSRKSSSPADKNRSKDGKDSKSTEMKAKHHSSEKRSHKRSSSGIKTERDIIMNQLRALELKAANRNKTGTISQSPSEKPRDPVSKSKTKSTTDSIKSTAIEPKDDKTINTKNASDQGSSTVTSPSEKSRDQVSKPKMKSTSDSSKTKPKEPTANELKDDKTVNAKNTLDQGSSTVTPPSEKSRDPVSKPKIKPTSDSSKTKPKEPTVNEPKDDKTVNAKSALDQGSSTAAVNQSPSEKPRDPVTKPKVKSTSDSNKSKAKETNVNDPKDDKSMSAKNTSDQITTSNRKSQQPAGSSANRTAKSNRCGTDLILSECYLPKQVKYDESLYSIEALKAAQAAQEEQMKADAEAAKKAREILAAKEEQAKAARAAARLAKQEEARAEAERLAKIEAEKLAKIEAEKLAKMESEKAAKLAKAAAKALRSKQAKENLNRSNDSPRIESFGLFATKDDSQESRTSSPRLPSNQDFIPENFKNSPAFVQYQPLGQQQNDNPIAQMDIKSDETVLPPVDEEETSIRRSGRIKTITETKQRACGFGLVKDKDKFHNMYVGDLSYSSMSDSQYMSDYNSSNSNSMLDLSEIDKDYEMELPVVKKEKTAEELEQERVDVAAGLSLFKQIVDCEYRSERTISKETKKMTCDCFLTKSEIERGELGCGEDCLNRLIFIECGSRCAIGDRCTNKRFQKHQNSDCTIFKAGKKGYGLKAVSVIEAGDFIMEYVGEVLNSKQFDERRFKYSNDNIQHHYFMALRSDCVIDATIKGNISRFINHSCDPNAETQKWTVNGELRIGFFSTRTIQPDEEITFDYQFQRYGKEAQRCYCEAENCRGWIGEEPDSEDEEDEEDEDEEAEDEEESEEETGPIEAEEVAPVKKELIEPVITVGNDSIQPIMQEETNEKPQVDEKPIVTIKKPSPTKKIRKPKQEPRPKKYKIKKPEIMVDPDLDHEIATLMETNLKNQAHTLRFSRLMVRAKMLDARSKLLTILRHSDQPCKRLFLDYHGLKLLHTWMCDPISNNVQEDWSFRLDILETMEFLPIPNKNMLQDSKVLFVVLKWANSASKKVNVKSPEESPSDSGSGTPISEGNSPKVEDGKNIDTLKVVKTEPSDAIIESIKIEPKEETDVTCSPKSVIDSSKDSSKDISKNPDATDTTNDTTSEQLKTGEVCADDELMEQIRLMATKLLESWEALKEVFRIPKKLRIEQMKEHEQEANRTLDWDDSAKRSSDSVKGKDREPFKKEKRMRPMDPTDAETMLLKKVQHRRLFEAKMAQESIDKRNYERQIEAIHVAKCKYFQLDPRITSYRDIPFSVSPLTGQWFSKDGDMIATPPSHAHIKPPQELPTNPDEYDIPPMDLPPQWKFAIDLKGRLYYYHVKIRIPQWDPPIKILPLREEPTHGDDSKTESGDDNEIDTKDDSLMLLNVANEIDSEKDDDSDESSDAIDSSEDELMQKRQQLLNSFQANQTDLDISANLAVEISAMATTSDKGSMDDSTDISFNLDNSLMHSSGKKKNRDGLATERLISPRTDEERQQGKIESLKYKANKEKFRRRKENAKLRLHGSSSEPARKLKKLTEGLPVVSQQDDDVEETDDEDESNVCDLEVGALNAKFVDELDGIKSEKINQQKLRLDAIRSNRKVAKRKRPEPEPVPYNSNEAAKRIKEKFCAEMSGVIVQHLGPYRKDDCKIGRIANNDDFKHLARKLTHFVMLKELKHCDNTVTVLEVTDSVRAKSKEFIRKYMAKFGDVYVKPDNDPEYKEFCNT